MVEHPAAVRQVLGSTPSVPFDFFSLSFGYFFSPRKKGRGPNRDLNPGPPAPKAGIIPLDHLATASGGSTRKKRNDDLARERKCKKFYGSGGIRTHAPEETGALNQRLRPLGHATLCLPAFPKPAKTQAFMSSLLYLKSMPPVRLELTAFRL